MTFERPAYLLLLLGLPLIWWLHRQLSGPREIVVSSLLPYRAETRHAPPVRQERRLDVELLLLLLAGGLLALFAAGPATARGPRLRVAVDQSAAFRLRTLVDGRTAQRAAIERFERAVPDRVELEWLELDAPLGELVTRARRDGLPGLVVVTARAIPSTEELVVVRPDVASRDCVRVVDAALVGDEVVVTLQRVGRSPATVFIDSAVRGTSRSASFDGDLTVATVSLPLRDGTAEARTEWQSADGEAGEDAFGEHVGLLLVRRGGARTARVDPRLERVREAVLAAGLDVVPDQRVPDEQSPDVQLIVGDDPAPVAIDGVTPPHVRFAMRAGARSDPRASTVRGFGGFDVVRPADHIALVAWGRLDDADDETLLRDALGPLARAEGSAVATTLDPEHPDSTWHSDSSFPVFVQSAIEAVTGGPERVELISDVSVRDDELELAPGPEVDATALEQLVTESARPQRLAGAWLLALAAALAIGIVVLRREAARRISMGRPAAATSR